MSRDAGIELVVFDLTGTTVYDGEVVKQCLRAALTSAGLKVNAKAVNRVLGLPKPEAFRILISEFDFNKRLTDRADELYTDFATWMRRCFRVDPSVREINGASKVFHDLKQAGIKVALNSSFNRELVDILLDRLEWRENGLIDATVASDEVERGRPHPDMIHHLMKQLGVRNSKCVVKIGDTPEDLLEGNNAACGLVIGVTKGSHTREQLRKYPHDALLGTIAELPSNLGLLTNDKVYEELNVG